MAQYTTLITCHLSVLKKLPIMIIILKSQFQKNCQNRKLLKSQFQHLKQHKQSKHDINVVWHSCDLCSYKCKKKGHLKQHKQSIHDIDVVIYCAVVAAKNKNLTAVNKYLFHEEEFFYWFKIPFHRFGRISKINHLRQQRKKRRVRQYKQL